MLKSTKESEARLAWSQMKQSQQPKHEKITDKFFKMAGEMYRCLCCDFYTKEKVNALKHFSGNNKEHVNKAVAMEAQLRQRRDALLAQQQEAKTAEQPVYQLVEVEEVIEQVDSDQE